MIITIFFICRLFPSMCVVTFSEVGRKMISAMITYSHAQPGIINIHLFFVYKNYKLFLGSYTAIFGFSNDAKNRTTNIFHVHKFT